MWDVADFVSPSKSSHGIGAWFFWPRPAASPHIETQSINMLNRALIVACRCPHRDLCVDSFRRATHEQRLRSSTTTRRASTSSVSDGRADPFGIRLGISAPLSAPTNSVSPDPPGEREPQTGAKGTARRVLCTQPPSRCSECQKRQDLGAFRHLCSGVQLGMYWLSSGSASLAFRSF